MFKGFEKSNSVTVSIQEIGNTTRGRPINPYEFRGHDWFSI